MPRAGRCDRSYWGWLLGRFVTDHTTTPPATAMTASSTSLAVRSPPNPATFTTASTSDARNQPRRSKAGISPVSPPCVPTCAWGTAVGGDAVSKAPGGQAAVPARHREGNPPLVGSSRVPGQSSTGCGAAWLARLTGGQEVAGSNPASPTPHRARAPEQRRPRATGSPGNRLPGDRLPGGAGWRPPPVSGQTPQTATPRPGCFPGRPWLRTRPQGYYEGRLGGVWARCGTCICP